VLQLLELEEAEQATPPLAAGVMVERDLLLVPEPQVLLHEPYADHPETTQSTGQAKVLQVLYL